jgi:hypothetical protein
VIGTVKVRVIDACITVACAAACYALRHTIMAGRVLRSGDPAGVQQEMWSLLTLYQALRTVMALAHLLPARRQRVSTRKGKSPISRYSERHCDGRLDVVLAVVSLDVSIHEPSDMQPALLTRSRDE